MNEPRPITSDEEHAILLAEIEALVIADPDPDTPEGARLNALADVIVEYERRRWPMTASS
jgi:antitoxin component HigA of HigAB toxin-antitoxin module